MQPGESAAQRAQARRGARGVPPRGPGSAQAADRRRPGRGASGRRHHRPRLPPPCRARPAPPPSHPRRANSTSPSSAASSRPACTTARRSPSWPPSAADRSWPDCSTMRCDKLAEEDDPVERQRHALTFWDHIVDGADSIAFRLMYNTLRATYEPALPALAAVMADEVGRPRGVPRSRRRDLGRRSRRGPDKPRTSYSNPQPRPCWPPSTTWRISDDHRRPGGAPPARVSRWPTRGASSGNTPPPG